MENDTVQQYTSENTESTHHDFEETVRLSAVGVSEDDLFVKTTRGVTKLPSKLTICALLGEKDGECWTDAVRSLQRRENCGGA